MLAPSLCLLGAAGELLLRFIFLLLSCSRRLVRHSLQFFRRALGFNCMNSALGLHFLHMVHLISPSDVASGVASAAAALSASGEADAAAAALGVCCAGLGVCCGSCRPR